MKKKKKMQKLRRKIIFWKNKAFCECGSLSVGYGIQSFERKTCSFNNLIFLNY
jgi:hypothetical protein